MILISFGAPKFNLLYSAVESPCLRNILFTRKSVQIYLASEARILILFQYEIDWAE